jgi:hypothetical protein
MYDSSLTLTDFDPELDSKPSRTKRAARKITSS